MYVYMYAYTYTHTQVLFDGGLWYVGLCISVRPRAAAGGRDSVDLVFEDGEQLTVSSGDDDAVLLCKEWSNRVSLHFCLCIYMLFVCVCNLLVVETRLTWSLRMGNNSLCRLVTTMWFCCARSGVIG
jgi:hypothetical protein